MQTLVASSCFFFFKPKYKFVTKLLNVNKTFYVHVTVKKLNTPEYRHYLKLWNQETKPKRENTKDLPKLNQVRLHPLHWFLFVERV